MKLRRILSTLITGCAILFSLTPLFADSFTFATIPQDGAIMGPPGATIGWGYTIMNESLTSWLEMTALSADPFLNGTPNATFDFPILSPGTTASAPYDPLNGLFGLYEFTWDFGAPIGFSNTGTFILSGAFYDADPLSGGTILSPMPGDQSASYSASVVASTPIPESATWLLLTCGLLALIVLHKRISSP